MILFEASGELNAACTINQDKRLRIHHVHESWQRQQRGSFRIALALNISRKLQYMKTN
jgi:hypothetical protein